MIPSMVYGMDCFCIFAKKEGVEQRKIIRQEGKA